jgi:hypothetical protein
MHLDDVLITLWDVPYCARRYQSVGRILFARVSGRNSEVVAALMID